MYRLLVIVLFTTFTSRIQCNYQCGFTQVSKRGSVEECNRGPATQNLPLISGAYCFNDGSGLCKAFAGRYEFFYDSFNDKFLYSAPQSQYVNEYGYHERIPVSYTIDGEIMYADRSINWARRFADDEFKDKNISLMSISTLNWCAFVAENHWPYKSAIKYEQYQIYFFNRQSCIIDTSIRTQPKQHFNTRFLHNSSVRQDLDMNPTIYAMEDNLANEIRLVKHQRQHWHEVAFKVLKEPAPGVDYFVDMEPRDRPPCKICGNRPILPKDAYRNFSDLCLSDFFHRRPDGLNSRLVNEFCGFEKTEIADYPVPLYGTGMILEVDLHNIPRRPNTTTRFFGVDIRSDEDWVIWAKDGLTFSAATTIPEQTKNKVRVIMLYATFKIGVSGPRYYEYDPMPYIADYTAEFRQSSDISESSWVYDRKSARVQATNLNYVDDIAYLYKCMTLLVIFGPFYNELPVTERISLDTKGPAGSIYDLGIYEPVNAFFAMPDGSNVFWAYYRTNYIAEHRYECGTPIVTATRSGSYLARQGPNSPPIFTMRYQDRFISEEVFFQHIGVFKGKIEPIEAPDPKLYEEVFGPPAKPLEEKDQTYIYIIIAIGVLLIVTMCIICMIAVRRRIRRRRHLKTVRSGNLDDGSQPEKSTRSLLSWLPFSGASDLNKTRRSALYSSPSKRGSSKLPATVRSARTDTPTKSSASARSAGLGSGSRDKSHTSATRRSARSNDPSKSSASVRTPSLDKSHPSATRRSHSRPSSASSNRSGRSRHSGSQKL